MGAEPVVPEGDVAELPSPADGELRFGEMREQERQQRVALLLRELDNPRGEALVDE